MISSQLKSYSERCANNMAGTRNTKKQVSDSRTKSIEHLKNGKWKERFDETLNSFQNEKNPELRESLKYSLFFQSKAWGINNFPELKEYAEQVLTKLDNEQMKKLTAAEFVQRWRNRGKSNEKNV